MSVLVIMCGLSRMLETRWLPTADTSGGWEAPGQGAGSAGVWCELSSWFADSCLVCSCGREDHPSPVSFIEALIIFTRAPPSWSSHLSENQLLKPSLQGFGFLHMSFGGTHPVHNIFFCLLCSFLFFILIYLFFNSYFYFILLHNTVLVLFLFNLNWSIADLQCGVTFEV